MALLINELYLAILPIVHLGDRFGLTEQVITLFPDKSFATLFRPEEVDGYLLTFKQRAERYLTSGDITYEYKKEHAANGMVIVKVMQNVNR